MSPLRVAVAGASGRMGRMLIEAVLASDDCSLAGALDTAGNPNLGNDAGAFAGRFGAKFVRLFALRVHPQSTLMFDHILILGRGPVNQPWGHTLTSNSMVHPAFSL